MTHLRAKWLVALLILGMLSAACGKYGRPQRRDSSGPAAELSVLPEDEIGEDLEEELSDAEKAGEAQP